MGVYRDEEGTLIEIDDRMAEARGYTPATSADKFALTREAADQARGEERGIIGDINAFGTGVLSTASLGGTDWLLAQTLTPLQRERVEAEIKASPGWRAAGEVVGAVGSALAAPGSLAARTPAGYLGSVAAREVEAGLAAGGVRGTARALGAMGAEGAAQSAGQYIGHAALEDKELTAEGLTGSLGTGFAFGAGGGGALLGVTKGFIAGRRLYSRVMGGEKAAQDAASSWSTASQEALEADMSTARALEIQQETVRTAKMEALRGRNQARSAAQEAALDAQGARVAPVPGDFEAGIPTNVIPKVGREIPEAGMPAAGAATDLETALQGTKAKLDEGASLKEVGESAVPGSPVSPQIPPGKTPPAQPGRKMESSSINDWLNEKAAFDAGELSAVKKVEDLKGAAELRMRRQKTLSEIRYKATEDLLGPQIAKQEQEVADALDEFHAARKDFEELAGAGPESTGVPVYDIDGHMSELRRPGADVGEFTGPQPATAAGRPGNRKAIEIIDDAHEEALLRGKYAADPREAGQAITEAEELENLLEGLTAPRLHGPSTPMSKGELRSPNAERWSEELMDAAAKVTRYEKASAKLADLAGDAVHPVSAEKTKMLRAAERDSERKMYDRSARAVDDAGEPVHPKVAAARAAKQKQIDAQRKLDELGVQHKEASREFSVAAKKVKAGESAKKAALKEDAKLAGGVKTAGTASTWGGILEIADIPGLPKPSDLPIVGPLLGVYLKFRTIKQAMGRAMGKVPATADARVAAIASQNRDRVARAVDRSIGALERGAKGAARVVPSAAGVLAHRIYDDGGEDPKGKDVQDLAAARMRELTSYVHTPGAIERDVRRELADVSDPDLIAAVEKQRRVAMAHLLSVAPKLPEQSLLNPIKYRPSGGQAMSFARSVAAVGDPAGVFERLAQEQAMISLEAAEALRKVYPKMFAEAGMRLMERAQEGDLKVPMRTRVQLSLLYKVPLDTALDPDNLKITQSVYDRKVQQPAPGMQGVPTQPSIANPVTLSQGLTPAADRR